MENEQLFKINDIEEVGNFFNNESYKKSKGRKSKNKKESTQKIRKIDLNYEIIPDSVTLDILGIQIVFPYQPYEIEKKYMQKVK